MKKLFLLTVLIFLLLTPVFTSAALVSCDGPNCTIKDFFETLAKIYNFIVFWVATPLATITISVGAIFMMVSAGNPGVMANGKRMVIISIIGLVLVYCSYVIINVILTTLGFTGNWANPF